MGAKVRIKAMLKSNGKNYMYLAEMLGLTYQTTRDKMARDTLKYNDVEFIADKLGYDIVFRDRKTGEEV